MEITGEIRGTLGNRGTTESGFDTEGMKDGEKKWTLKERGIDRKMEDREVSREFYQKKNQKKKLLSRKYKAVKTRK